MDALNKLGVDELLAARQQMLKTILAQRFKVAPHVMWKELPVYVLVIARAVPSFRKPLGEKYAGRLSTADGPKSTAGMIGMLPVAGGSRKIISNGGPFELLAGYLTGAVWTPQFS